MITPEARRYIARRHMMWALARVHERTMTQMSTQLDADYDTATFTHTTSEAEHLTDRLPGVDDLETWDALERRLGTVGGLGYEDRRYVADVRCAIRDAIRAATHADFATATERIGAARDQLHWVVHGRRREGGRHEVWLWPEQKQRLTDLLGALEPVVTAITRARNIAGA